MVLDTSALLAILFAEPERERFIELLSRADDPLLSTVTHVETSIVMAARIGDDGVADLDDLLVAGGVRQIAVDTVQAQLAREAFARFGKGRHPAALTFGDCFSYALAVEAERPLLFKGDDFARTDVTPADA